MSRSQQFARKYWFEAPILLLTIEGIVEVITRRDAPGAPRTTLWFILPAVAVIVLPLFARRRFPFAALMAYWVLASAVTFVDGQLIPFMSSLFAIGMAVSFLLGNLRDSVKARTGLAVVLAGSVIVVFNVPGHAASDFALVPLEFGISWLAGFALRGRAEQAEAAQIRAVQAERERETTARIAVADERARIARELHDIVAHAVSVMVLQVGAVRHKLPAAMNQDRDALEAVERTGRSALAEMRRLLTVMRRDGDRPELTPQPGLDRLDSLADDIGRAGLAVQLHVDGDPFPLPRGVDLSAYRIVQEGLTNALKHAQATHATVTVRYAADAIAIEIRDDGQGSSATGDQGHGLIGIRERVNLYGGEMTAGTINGGGFTLSTRLPVTR